MDRIEDGSIIAADRIRNADPAAERSPATIAHLESFFALSLLAPEAAPPPELERRIVEIGRFEAELPAATGPMAAAEPLSRGALRLLVLPSRIPVIGVIMILVALVLSIAANVLFLRSHEFRPETALYLVGTGASSGAKGVILSDGATHVLHVSGLDQLTSGYRYVVWIHDGLSYTWAGSITMLDGGNGRLVMNDLPPVESVEVTIEATGKSTSPEGPRILAGLAGW